MRLLEQGHLFKVQISARLKTPQSLHAPVLVFDRFLVNRDLLSFSWDESCSDFSIPPREVVGESSKSPAWLYQLIGLQHY